MANVGITDGGIGYAANIAQAAAVAVAVLNTVAAIEMASKQETLARNYLNIAKEENQYYFDVYVPCENAEIAEACSAPLYTTHTDVQVGRMLNTVRHSFAGHPEKELQCVSRYCTGKQAMLIKDLLLSEATALATAGNLARRYEEQYADAQNDLRWARRAQALNRGRDMMSQAVEFSGFAYGLFGRLGDQAMKGAAGAVRYLGYAETRNDTVYPTRRQMERRVQPVYGTSYPLPNPELEVVPQPVPQRRIRG
jgi:hypothetical protein